MRGLYTSPHLRLVSLIFSGMIFKDSNQREDKFMSTTSSMPLLADRCAFVEMVLETASWQPRLAGLDEVRLRGCSS